MRNTITQRKCLNLWAFRQMVTNELVCIAEENSQFDTHADNGKIRLTYKTGHKTGLIEYYNTFAECQGKVGLYESVLNAPKLNQQKQYNIMKGLN